MTDNKPFSPIAIIGVGGIFPGAANPVQLWRNILESRDLITEVPAGHWLTEDYYDPNPEAVDKIYCKRGAFLPTVDFDPVEYGMPPNVLPVIDSSQLLALLVAKQVLDDATNGRYADMDLSRVSVILGSSTLEAYQSITARLQRPVWEKAMRQQGVPEAQIAQICDRIAACYVPLQENTFPGLLQNVIAGRIANRFNLGGTNCILDAACASSLAALAMAIGELQTGVTDFAISGGIDTLNDIVSFMCFAKTKALSVKGDCRPFSDDSDGTILGEGVGFFALKRLEDAEQQNDKIYAVIRGLGTASDGRSKSIYAPLSKGQSKAEQRAYAQAGFNIGTVELIEGHGTGTKAGDLAEFQGLEMTFKESGHTQVASCALGSIKSQIGHTKAAAGAAGLFKAVMALHHKVLPATIKLGQPNRQFELDKSPLYLNTQLRPWVHPQAEPRRAGVSAFGFGGSDFHVALEEYTGSGRKAARLRTFPSELVLLAAANPTELVAAGQAMLQQLPSYSSLSAVAQQTQLQLSAEHRCRLAIVANDIPGFTTKLQQALASIQEAGEQAISLKQGIYYANQANPGQVMFMFPGQGSQYLGMGADVAMAFSDSMAVWDQAGRLSLDEQFTLQDVVFPKHRLTEEQRDANEQRLRATEFAQPALAVHSLMHLDLLTQLGLKPDAVCGHSFGELTALYAAGVMDAETLIRLARKRGELMRDAAQTPGAMLSVFYPAADVLAILEKQHLKATPANFNAPNQLVLSGSVAEIEAAQAYFTQEKIRCQRLTVATGFHSHLVQPSCQPLREFLTTLTWQAPKLPVWANLTGEIYPDDVNAMKDQLAQQLANPVRFQTQIENAYAQGVRTFIEVGAHNVLTGLVNYCLENRPFKAIHLDRRGEHGVTSLWHGLAQLFCQGLNPNFQVLWREYAPQDKLPITKKQGFTIQINGTNYHKPYPPGNFTEQTHDQRSEPATASNVIPADNAPATNNVAPVSNIIHASKVIPEAPASNIVPASNDAPTHPTISATEETNMSQTNNPYLVQMQQALQLELVNSHNIYQKAMAESHIAFLNSISRLADHAASGVSMELPASAGDSSVLALPNVVTSLPQPVVVAPPVTAPAPVAAAVAPVAVVSAPVIAAAPVQPQVQAPPPPLPIAITAPVVVNTPPPAAVPQAPVAVAAPVPAADDLQTQLLNVVVEKTGYPAEMLNMDMAIEADLGIDSIKRVEILSTLVQRIPNLPEINPNELGKLQTLGDILRYVKQAKR